MSPQINSFFEFNERLEAILTKAYIYRSAAAWWYLNVLTSLLSTSVSLFSLCPPLLSWTHINKQLVLGIQIMQMCCSVTLCLSGWSAPPLTFFTVSTVMPVCTTGALHSQDWDQLSGCTMERATGWWDNHIHTQNTHTWLLLKITTVICGAQLLR